MSKSEVVETESAALNGEAEVASSLDASDDRNSIVTVRARLMDGLPELGDVLRPVLEGTPATKVFMLEPLQYGNISEDFRVAEIAEDDSPRYQMLGQFNVQGHLEAHRH